MNNKEFICTYVICLIPILSLWLIPKDFMVNQATGSFFGHIRKYSFDFNSLLEAAKTAKKFKQEYNKTYYYDLAKFSLVYMVLAALPLFAIYCAVNKIGCN